MKFTYSVNSFGYVNPLGEKPIGFQMGNMEANNYQDAMKLLEARFGPQHAGNGEWQLYMVVAHHEECVETVTERKILEKQQENRFLRFESVN